MSAITDAERLEFILDKSRKVVVEMCYAHHEVYVEEGFMSDKKYSAVCITEEYNSWGKDDLMKYRRQAIDLAITESKL